MSFYQKKTSNTPDEKLEPVVSLGGEFLTQVAGFELNLSLVYRGKEMTRTFAGRGSSDLITRTSDEVNAFIADKTGGAVGKVSGGRSFAGICTGNWDALVRFLKAEEAWAKLDSETADADYRTAVEIDPGFSLARLKLAEVQIFRGDQEQAAAELKAAGEHRDRLIDYDLLRLSALVARLNSKPAEEREYLRRLVEAFPLNREYHYEFAESYFHAGDGAEAAKDYIKALEIDPSYALAHNHLAFCYAWTGDHAKAEEHFKRYVELDNTANSYDSLASGYMFAGNYEQAVQACDQGLALDPKLYYLYTTKATNLTLLGRLAEAEAAIGQEVGRDSRETTKLGARFDTAYIEFLRGNLKNADNALVSLRLIYSGDAYKARLDESPNLPFWLAGVIAARQKNGARLHEMIAVLDKKIADNGVNATNFFPVLKLTVHLKALEAALNRKPEEALAIVEEGARIKAKMGYWSSQFDRTYILDELAEALIGLGNTAKARELLQEVLAYNPHCASAHVHLAGVLKASGDLAGARAEAGTARTLLAKADKDFALVKALEAVDRGLK